MKLTIEQKKQRQTQLVLTNGLDKAKAGIETKRHTALFYFLHLIIGLVLATLFFSYVSTNYAPVTALRTALSQIDGAFQICGHLGYGNSSVSMGLDVNLGQSITGRRKTMTKSNASEEPEAVEEPEAIKEPQIDMEMKSLEELKPDPNQILRILVRVPEKSCTNTTLLVVVVTLFFLLAWAVLEMRELDSKNGRLLKQIQRFQGLDRQVKGWREDYLMRIWLRGADQSIKDS